jgi:hypothetical protein
LLEYGSKPKVPKEGKVKLAKIGASKAGAGRLIQALTSQQPETIILNGTD